MDTEVISPDYRLHGVRLNRRRLLAVELGGELIAVVSERRFPRCRDLELADGRHLVVYRDSDYGDRWYLDGEKA